MKTNFIKYASLVSYPNDKTMSLISKFNNEKKDVSLKKFNEFVESVNLSALQERFTQTFDMNPSTCLDIGWHLYGEAYQRGAFLVELRQLLKENKIKESSELPDHFTHILAILDILKPEDQQQFIVNFVIPAIKKILIGFGDEKNPYKHVIEFLSHVFETQLKTYGGEA
jgi:nitrate reductase molybdenum cofactor assembly chaperone NarJ/NarW